MVTHYDIASHSGFRAHTAPAKVDGFGTRVFAAIRQVMCGIGGHDNLMQFEKGRMYLQCASCGHETPGWELAGNPPAISVRGDERRLQLMHPQMARARRVA
jgi:hypothetical protein